MTSTQDAEKATDEQMNCMEVWGGSCASEDCLRRPGLDIWIQSQSAQFADAGGGELHLLSSCASGRITRMLLADICGIGPLFSEIAGDLRDLMKRSVNAIQQQRIVRDVSSRLEEVSHKGGFASMLIHTFYAPTRSFSLCNTGHPPPLVFRSKEHRWSLLKQTPAEPSSLASLDGVVHPDAYQHVKTKLDVGDMVLSYGEGFTECRDVNGQIIGLRGLLDRAQELDTGNPATLLSSLQHRLRDENGDNSAVEDATLLLCQATETKVALRDNLLAPFRLFGSVSDSTRID